MPRLVGLWSHNRAESETKGLVSPGDYFEWKARARGVQSISPPGAAVVQRQRRRRRAGREFGAARYAGLL